MTDVSGAATFHVSGDSYDRFMGRYSRALAPAMADFCALEPGLRLLDVGCGPGAFTAEAVRRLGAGAVVAVDPSPSFVAACRAANPGVEVSAAAMETLELEAGAFDRVVAQLVLHFVSDPTAGAARLARLLRPGGLAAAAVWDFEEGMQMLRAFWDAALSVDPEAPDEARTMRFGRPGEITTLFADAGLIDLEETTLTVATEYAGFDELWAGLLAGIGPAGSYCVAQPPGRRDAIRDELFTRIGRPAGRFDLRAVARAARGRVP